MTYSYYILLYTAIYDFCTQNKPHVTTFGAGARGGASLQGAELYRSLHTFLSEHCKSLREVSFHVFPRSHRLEPAGICSRV